VLCALNLHSGVKGQKSKFACLKTADRAILNSEREKHGKGTELTAFEENVI
jgi:hypothetical protein